MVGYATAEPNFRGQEGGAMVPSLRREDDEGSGGRLVHAETRGSGRRQAIHDPVLPVLQRWRAESSSRPTGRFKIYK